MPRHDGQVEVDEGVHVAHDVTLERRVGDYDAPLGRKPVGTDVPNRTERRANGANIARNMHEAESHKCGSREYSCQREKRDGRHDPQIENNGEATHVIAGRGPVLPTATDVPRSL